MDQSPSCRESLANVLETTQTLFATARDEILKQNNEVFRKRFQDARKEQENLDALIRALSEKQRELSTTEQGTSKSNASLKSALESCKHLSRKLNLELEHKEQLGATLDLAEKSVAFLSDELVKQQRFMSQMSTIGDKVNVFEETVPRGFLGR